MIKVRQMMTLLALVAILGTRRLQVNLLQRLNFERQMDKGGIYQNVYKENILNKK